MAGLNIYQRMAAITQEISNVAKNLMVGEGRASYKAVGEADVLAAVKPIENKYGVYSYPVSRKVIESGEMRSVKEYNGNKTETIKLYLRLETVYRFVNVDDPTQYIDITTYGDGVDTQDKAPGKAMTYSDKYALLKAYKIMTGDDPDQLKSEEVKSKTIGTVRAAALLKLLTEKDVNIAALMGQYNVTKLEDLTEAQHADVVRRLSGNGRKNS